MGYKRTARNIICWALASILRLSGYIRKAKNRSFQDGVIIAINCHNTNAKLFEKVIIWLKKNGYTFISSTQLVDILSKKASCPRGAVCISFDDGWQGNVSKVVPVAVKYNVPITIFICTEAIETGTFWWKRVMECAGSLPVEYRNVQAILKQPEETRKHVLDLVKQAGSNVSFRKEAMTLEELKHISGIEQVTIGSHTVSHPILPNCADEQIDFEISQSKKQLEEWIGKPVKVFAYPNGAYDRNVKQVLEKYGYELAATTERRFVKLDDDAYSHPRTDIMDDGTFTENLCHLFGVWDPVINRIKKITR